MVTQLKGVGPKLKRSHFGSKTIRHPSTSLCLKCHLQECRSILGGTVVNFNFF